VVDCITDSETMKICYDAMGTTGGKYVAVGPYSTKLQRIRRDIKPDWVMAWTVFGKTIALSGVFRRAPMPEDREFATGFSRLIEKLLEEGKLKTHPVKLETKGLLGIPDGLDMIRHGRVSGRKLVYCVD
jgi:aspyridone synthetase trans-acting enoyl reductase